MQNDDLVNGLRSDVDSLNTKLDQLLSYFGDSKDIKENSKPPTGDNTDKADHAVATGLQKAVLSPINHSVGCASEDLQGDYQAIASSVQSLKLPPEFVVKTQTRQGINRENQPCFNVVARSAKYAETSLKLLSQIPDPIQDNCKPIQDLIKVQVAQIKYLQEELAQVVVSSQFDANTSRLFRNLQKNTSVLDSESLTVLRSAVELSAASGRGSGSNHNNHSQSGNYRNNYRGGFRGGRNYGDRDNKGWGRGRGRQGDFYNSSANTQNFSKSGSAHGASDD